MVIKAVYACLMVLFFATMPAFAQDQSSGDEHQAPSAEDIVAKMQSKLNLTQDQVTAITPILEKYSSKREELRQSIEDGTADRDSMRSQMKELRSDEGQELAQVLSADQMSQWSSMQSQMHHHSQEGGGGDGSGTSGGSSGGDNPPPQN